jgi:hypothetical protein
VTKFRVLDKKPENESMCYLCKIELKDYLDAIPDNYRDFSVQRGIVANRYLDHLVDTIKKKQHIPPLVLVTNTAKLDGDTLEVEKFEILDGLQRTHRLKAMLDAVSFLISISNELGLDEANNSRSLYRKRSSDFKAIGADRQLISSLISYDAHNLNDKFDFFDKNPMWIEVWTGLNEQEQIKKMLLLNAGHKSVNIKHQLELLFLGTLLKLETISPGGIEFKREKEMSAIQYSKNRTLGIFHFSHIISALIALSAGKVVNTNSDFVSNMQSGTLSEVELVEGFDLDFLSLFIQFMSEMDRSLSKHYGDVGIKWLGREVVLIGFFGAIGALAKDSNTDLRDYLSNLKNDVKTIVNSLEIDAFEIARNRVELNKVNVGSINKKAVYLAVTDLLSKEKFLGWGVYFGGGSK